MHVPRKTTELLQKEIERLETDSLISFGGGSPIDSCKVAAYGLCVKGGPLSEGVRHCGGSASHGFHSRIPYA